jgi:8-oxo-dGTP pyrophosphatase MutT (NUDIX family)
LIKNQLNPELHQIIIFQEILIPLIPGQVVLFVVMKENILYTIKNMIQQQEYVIGYAFDPTYKNVILIVKNRPDHLKGKTIGVGGKIEKFDLSPNDAMRREFKEETGLISGEWIKIKNYIAADGGLIHAFYTIIDDLSKAETITDEQIIIRSIDELLNNNPDILHPFVIDAIKTVLNHLNNHLNKT